MQFQDLNLIEPILKALKHEGYTTPTPIQAQAIPLVLEGNDLLGCAQTGTGKTAAIPRRRGRRGLWNQRKETEENQDRCG
jgi:superfamily II helicase